jgi:hypothetical protein
MQNDRAECGDETATAEYHNCCAENGLRCLVFEIEVGHHSHQKKGEGRQSDGYFEQDRGEFEEGLVLLFLFIDKLSFNNGLG